MMFFSAVTVALSVEEVGLHRRVAINVLLIFGGKVEWLLIIFLYVLLLIAFMHTIIDCFCT